MHIISFGKIVKVLGHIDGHRRVIDQSLSHHIYTITSTYHNIKTLYITLLSYLEPTHQTSPPMPCIYTALEERWNSKAYWRSSTPYWPKRFTPHIQQDLHVPRHPTALYYITYLSLANPSNIGPQPRNACKLHWKKHVPKHPTMLFERNH